MYLLNPKNNSPKNKARNNKGLVFLITVLGLGTVMTTFAMALLSMTMRAYQTTSQVTDNTTAFSLAEQGLDYAISQLNVNNNPTTSSYNCASASGASTNITLPSSITNNTNANVRVNVSCPGNPPSTSSVYNASLNSQFSNSYRLMTVTATIGGTTQTIRVLLQPILGTNTTCSFPYALWGTGSVYFYGGSGYSWGTTGGAPNYVASYNVPASVSGIPYDTHYFPAAGIGTLGTVSSGNWTLNQFYGIFSVIQLMGGSLSNWDYMMMGGTWGDLYSLGTEINGNIYEFLSDPTPRFQYYPGYGPCTTNILYYPWGFGLYRHNPASTVVWGNVYSNANSPPFRYFSWLNDAQVSGNSNCLIPSTVNYWNGGLPQPPVPACPGAPPGTPGASGPPDLVMNGAMLYIDMTAPPVTNMSWTHMNWNAVSIPPGNYAFNSITMISSQIQITPATQAAIASGSQPPVKFYVSGYSYNSGSGAYSIHVDNSCINSNGIGGSVSNGILNNQIVEGAGSASQFQIYDSCGQQAYVAGCIRMVLYAPYSYVTLTGTGGPGWWYLGSVTGGAIFVTSNNYIGYDYNLQAANTAIVNPRAPLAPLGTGQTLAVIGYRAIGWQEL